MKYHVNKKTGRAGQCKATKKGCPLGADTPHFETKEEAQAHITKTAKSEHNTFKTMSKNNKNNSITPNDNIKEVFNKFLANVYSGKELNAPNRLGAGRKKALQDLSRYMETLDLNDPDDVVELRKELYKDSRRTVDDIYKLKDGGSDGTLNYYMGRNETWRKTIEFVEKLTPKDK